MKKLLLLLIVPFLLTSQSACHVFGKIKFVDYGEDFKAREVDYGQGCK